MKDERNFFWICHTCSTLYIQIEQLWLFPEIISVEFLIEP